MESREPAFTQRLLWIRLLQWKKNNWLGSRFWRNLVIKKQRWVKMADAECVPRTHNTEGLIPTRTDMPPLTAQFHLSPCLPPTASTTSQSSSRAAWSTQGSLLTIGINFSLNKRDYLRGEQPCFRLCRGNRSSTFCSHRLLGSNYVAVFLLWIVLFGCFTPSHPLVQSRRACRCPKFNPGRNLPLLPKSKKGSTWREIKCIAQVIAKSSSFLTVPSVISPGAV